MYVDRLLEMGLAKDWGICGVGVLPADRKMADVMAAQDGLYTLVLENPDGTRDARVIGSIVDYRYAPDDPEAVIELLAAPSTRIVSLTITEGGYNIDNLGEIAGSAGGDGVNVFGLVADALARRRDRGVASPTIVSCDNIEGNGDVARQAFTTYAERVHPGLGEWMSAHTRFPNSMVDRITPVTTPDVIAVLRRRIRRRGPVAGGCRAVHVVGARGRLLRRPAAVRGRRRAARRRRDALRVDEAAAAQRQPPVPVLLRLPGRLPVGARRGGRPAVRRIPARVHGFRGHADAQAGAGHRPARLQAHADRAVRQPWRQGHHRAAVLRLVGPHPEVAAAGHPGEPRRGWPDPAVGGHRGQLGAVRRGRRRAGRTDRRPGPARRHAGAAGPVTAREPDRVHRKHRGVRRSRVAAAVRRGLPVGAGLAAPRRSPRHARDAAPRRRRHDRARRTAAGAGHRRGADRHRRTRRTGHRRARRRQPA